MNKLLVLMSLVLFVSCNHNNTSIKDTKGVEIIDNVRHFSFEGHKYIKFSEGEGSNSPTSGVVHDPNCWCQTKHK